MANLWDELDDDQRNELVQLHLSGSKKDNANLNRARDQLANNPNLVVRLAEEAGFGHDADAEMSDTAPDGDETDNVMDGQNEIDRAVSASLGDTDVQETGSVTNQTEIPPPQEGESISEYMDRLMFYQDELGKSSGEERTTSAVDQEFQRDGRAFRETMEDLHYPAEEKEGDKAERMRTRSASQLVEEDMRMRMQMDEQGGRRRGPTGSYADERRRRAR